MNFPIRSLSEQDKQALRFIINHLTDFRLKEDEVEDLIEFFRNPNPMIKDYEEIK